MIKILSNTWCYFLPKLEHTLQLPKSRPLIQDGGSQRLTFPPYIQGALPPNRETLRDDSRYEDKHY